MAKNAIYQVDNGTGFDEIYFKTIAAQVICADARSAEVNLNEKAKTTDLTNGTIVVKKSTQAINLIEELITLPATAEINDFKLWIPDGEEKEITIYGYFNEANSIAVREQFVSAGNYSRVTTHTSTTVTTTNYSDYWGAVLGTINAGINVINMKIRRYSQKLYIDGTMGDGQRMTQFNGVAPISSSKGSQIDIQLFIKHTSPIYVKTSSKVGE